MNPATPVEKEKEMTEGMMTGPGNDMHQHGARSLQPTKGIQPIPEALDRLFAQVDHLGSQTSRLIDAVSPVLADGVPTTDPGVTASRPESTIGRRIEEACNMLHIQAQQVEAALARVEL